MSSINLNVGASAFEQLRAINTMAQSTSGSISGRIGLINQANGQVRVIKFNTHLGERLFGAVKKVVLEPEVVGSTTYPELVTTNWQMGRYIVKYEQNGGDVNEFELAAFLGHLKWKDASGEKSVEKASAGVEA